MPNDTLSQFLVLKHRVIFSLFRAAARLGVRLKMPLGKMVELLQMAYFEEARKNNKLKMAEIATLFGKSLRTVQTLHSRYQDDFFAPENEFGLRFELSLALGSGSKTREEILELYPDRSEADIDAALVDLELEKKIWQEDGLFHRNRSDDNFYKNIDISARVGALNHQMDVVAETVWHRFLLSDSEAPAGARVYHFVVGEERFRDMIEGLFEEIRLRTVEVEKEAIAEGETERHVITIGAGPRWVAVERKKRKSQ